MVRFLEFIGTVPDLIKGASAIIVLGWLAAVAYLVANWRRAAVACADFTKFTEGLEPPPPQARHLGLSQPAFDQLAQKARHLSGEAARWWEALSHSLVPYGSEGSADGYFLTRPVDSQLTEDAALGRLYHYQLHHAVPGLLTGFGLAATFVAILLALMGVSYNEADKMEPVKGIAGLINGLSGKFLSSVIALGAAVVFTLIEKSVERRLSLSFDGARQAFSRLVPVLTPERILLDIRKSAANQEVSLSNISSDLVDRFVSVFRDDLSPGLASGLSLQMASQLQPTLERMNSTLVELRSALERLEQQKQESVTGELRAMLEALQRSMQESLAEMGKTFHASLSGAAKDEFSSVQGTLQGTASVLQGMNARFTDLQASLERVIAKAEQTTSGQLDAGREQAEAMNALMRGLIEQLQTSSQHSMERVSAHLTGVVSDLSEKVAEVSRRMLEDNQKSAETSLAAANLVIERGDSWTADASRRLEALVGSIETRSQEFEQAGRTLLAAEKLLAATLAGNSAALKEIQGNAAQVAALSAALTKSAGDLRTLGEHSAKLAASMNEAVGGLKSSMQEHRGLLQAHDQVLGGYDKVFGTLDKRLEAVLKTVVDGLRQYNSATEQNFTALVKIVDGFLPKVAEDLRAQSADLKDSLEELTDVLDKTIKRFPGAAGPGAGVAPRRS